MIHFTVYTCHCLPWVMFMLSRTCYGCHVVGWWDRSLPNSYHACVNIGEDSYPVRSTASANCGVICSGKCNYFWSLYIFAAVCYWRFISKANIFSAMEKSHVLICGLSFFSNSTNISSCWKPKAISGGWNISWHIIPRHLPENAVPHLIYFLDNSSKRHAFGTIACRWCRMCTEYMNGYTHIAVINTLVIWGCIKSKLIRTEFPVAEMNGWSCFTISMPT